MKPSGDAQIELSSLLSRADAIAPGGVHSNVRLAGPRVFIDRGTGAWLHGVDGREYIDYVLGQGPNFLGHAPPTVLERVEEACRKGMIFGTQHPMEVQAAELVCSALGWPEMVRFGVSGTESVQAAIRLARAATGRSKVVRFEGHYHGWLDNVLMAEADGDWGPGSAGQPAAALRDVCVIPWNDADALARTMDRIGDQTAAVIMEPMMINAGAIQPAEGYLAAVRESCNKAGAVLIFDEVISGFRLGLGGASERFGVEPDLATYGKAMAGGWPVSALVGREEIMSKFADGEVNHSGTFNASIMAMAATIGTIESLMDVPPYDDIRWHGTALMQGIEDLGRKHGVSIHVQGLPQAFHVSFGSALVTDYRSLQGLDLERYKDFSSVLVEHGLWVTARGIWYVSSAHGDPELGEALQRFDRALSRFCEPTQ